jgi:glycosyltransferase involved in cell wall biosynthesis
MIPNKLFPTDHPFLEEVYLKILPSRGYHVFWLMQPSFNLNRFETRMWLNTTVYLMPNRMSNDLISKFIRNFHKILFLFYLLKVLQHAEIDIIQVRNRPFVGFLSLLIAKKNGIPFVFQKSFLDEEHSITKARLGFSSHRFIDLIKGYMSLWLNDYILRKSDLILPISSWLAKKYEDMGIPRRNILPLPMGFPNDWNFDPEVVEGIRLKYELKGKKVLLYLGTFNPTRNLEFVVDIMNQIKERCTICCLLMVGGKGEAQYRQRLEEYTLSRGVQDSIIFTGAVPRSMVPNYIEASDIGLSPINPLPVFAYSSPTKLVEMMGLGLPVVVNNELAEQRMLVEESGGGIGVSYSVVEFVKAIVSLLDKDNIRFHMGQRGREYIFENRTYEKLAGQIEERYRSITL